MPECTCKKKGGNSSTVGDFGKHFARFRIQRKILTDLCILPTQQITNLSPSWARILTFAFYIIARIQLGS